MANTPKEIHPVTFYDKDELPAEGTVHDWRPKMQKVEDEIAAEAPDSASPDDLAGSAKSAQ